MKILFRTINYERFFRYFEQSSITSQFSVSLPAALRLINKAEEMPLKGSDP